MVGLGTIFIAIYVCAVLLLWRGPLFSSRGMLWILMLTIPGCDARSRDGADLNPADRPSYPKEIATDLPVIWDFPERQQPRGFREKSTEHKFLTPVFGTAQPLHGLSGAIRRYAYTLSEGRTAHWLLLIAGDRVDVLENRIAALFSGQPDNPITETGVLREFKGGAYRTRFGQHRADLKHQPLDLVLWVLPYIAVAGAVYLGTRSSKRTNTGRHVAWS
jgi:hypothetical protein